MSRSSVLAACALLIGCHQDTTSTAAPPPHVIIDSGLRAVDAGPVARVAVDASVPADASPPSKSAIVLLSDRTPGRFEPVLCCEQGACRADDCARLIADGDAIALETGEHSTVKRGDTMKCSTAQTGRRGVLLGVDHTKNRIALATWPTDVIGRVVRPTPEARTLVKQTVAGDPDLASLKVTGIDSIDLDDDGVPEHVLFSRTKGVFLQQSGATIVRIVADPWAELLYTVDLDGDGVRESLFLDSKEPPDLIVIEGASQKELFRSPWYCHTPPRPKLPRFDGGVPTPEQDR